MSYFANILANIPVDTSGGWSPGKFQPRHYFFFFFPRLVGSSFDLSTPSTTVFEPTNDDEVQMQQTLRRPRPMRPPVSIHMMPDFSAYDSCNTQSVSAVPTGTAQPGPAFYSHKLLKRKRSESTDDSDDPEGRDYSYPHTRHPSLGRQCPVGESGYAPAKPDECGHIAKRARLADDFAELRLRGKSLSPTSGISPAAVPLWAPVPEPVLEVRTSPQLPPPPAVEIDLTDDYGHVRSRRSAHVALPHLSAPIPSEIEIDIPPTGILRGEVEEVVSPGVQAERSKSKPAADGNEPDIRMHGTSSYEPEKDRASLPFDPPCHLAYVLTVLSPVYRDYYNRPRRLLRLGGRVFHHSAVHVDINTDIGAVQNLKRVPVTVWEHSPSRV